MSEKTKKIRVGKIIKLIFIFIIISVIIFYIYFLTLRPFKPIYSLSADGTYYVTRSWDGGILHKDAVIDIPAEYNDIPIKAVVSLSVSAGTKEVDVTKITLPDGLLAIDLDYRSFSKQSFYDNDSNWDIEYIIDSNGNKIEIYRSLYISDYLVQVIFNVDALKNEEGLLKNTIYTVHEGTKGIAGGAFCTSTFDGSFEYSAEMQNIIINVPTSVSFVGTSIHSNGEGYNIINHGSDGIFTFNCNNVVINYAGSTLQWCEIENVGDTTNQGLAVDSFIVKCSDGDINLREYYNNN